MATEDIFLELKDIKGESIDDKLKDQLELHSWSWGASNSGSGHSGTGSGTGKASFSDASFMMRMDKSSVVLLQHCTTGKHIPTGKLIQRKAGDKPLNFLTFELKDIIVSSFQMSSSGQDAMVSISINFAEFKAVYAVQNKDGSKGAETEFAWNIAKSAKA